MGIKISALPVNLSAELTDLVPVVQSGTTSTDTLQKILNLFETNIQITPSNGGTGVANPTAHGIAIAEGSSNFNFLTLTNGQVLIGSASADPVPATLTAGANISITNGAGSITIASPSTINAGTTGQVAYYPGNGTAISGESLSALIDASIGSTQGDILYRDATGWSVLAPGTSGYLLQTQGVGANPQWALSPGSGTVNSGTVGQIAYYAANGTAVSGENQVSLAQGGTNASLTASNGGIVYSGASAFAVLAGTATANQVLLSGLSSAPAWSTATYLPTLTANGLLFASATNTMAQITTANSSILVTNGSGVPSWSTTLPFTLPATSGGTGVASPTAHTIPIAEGAANYNFIGPLTNGQLIIGSTGADPVAATLTAGTNISITNNAGSITIAATGAGGFGWTTVTGASQAMSPNNGYITNNAGLVTLSLPASSSIGDEIRVIGKGAGGWQISQGVGQQIIFGTTQTTVGAGGYLASTQAKDSIYLVCTVANTEWTVALAPQGNITVV